MRSSNIRYLPQVDHLRAVAAIWIVLYHGLFVIGGQLAPPETVAAAHQIPNWNPLYALWAEGHTAVALFMVLSGFIFAVGSLGHHVSTRDFLFNRVLRIYPLFVTVLLFNTAFRVVRPDIATFIATLLPVADLNLTGQEPYVEMAWAVSVECQFYLLFPFILSAFNRSVVRTSLIIIGAAIALRGLGVLAGMNARDLSYYHLIGRIDQFVLGMVAAALFLRFQGRERLFRLVFWLGLAASVGLIWAFHDLGGGFDPAPPWKILWPTAEGLAWSALVLGYAGMRQKLPPPLSRLACRIGERSFSIYLLHRIAISALPSAAIARLFGGSWDIQALGATLFVVLPVTIVVSGLTYRFIELPCLRRRRRYLATQAAVP